MDDLYVESFFQHKRPPPKALVEPIVELPTPKAELQVYSFLGLLQQELNKQFKDFFPIQKLLRQIEEGFTSSKPADALKSLEKLEELLDAFRV